MGEANVAWAIASGTDWLSKGGLFTSDWQSRAMFISRAAAAAEMERIGLRHLRLVRITRVRIRKMNCVPCCGTGRSSFVTFKTGEPAKQTCRHCKGTGRVRVREDGGG